MFATNSKEVGLFRLLLTLALVMCAVAGPSMQVSADGRGGSDAGTKTLAGAWFSTVTPTQVPAFVGLGTYSADGGITNTTSLSLGSPLESPGHGQWVRTGRDRYAVTFLAISADAAGNHILTSKVRANLRLSADGDEFTGVFQVDIFDPNGVLLGSDTGNVRARRIKVEPLP